MNAEYYLDALNMSIELERRVGNWNEVAYLRMQEAQLLQENPHLVCVRHEGRKSRKGRKGHNSVA